MTVNRKLSTPTHSKTLRGWFNQPLGGWWFALGLLGLAFVCYGLYIRWYGLFGDDWPYLYIHHVVGPAGYIPFVAGDRPFSAWIYLLTTPIFGEHVWLYHTFLLFLRWGCGMLLWWLLKLIWPGQTYFAGAAAALMVVYPGFQQQPIPLEFMLHFSVLALTLFSLAAMLKAVRSPQYFWPWTVAGLLAALGIFSVEYFVGLEALRPLILWLALRDVEKDKIKRLRRILLAWLPYLLVFGGFLFWRVVIFKFPTYTPSIFKEAGGSLAYVLAYFARRLALDFRTVLVDGWKLIFNLPTRANLWAYGVVLLLGLGLAGFIFGRRSQENPTGWLAQPLLLGAVGLVICGVPFWVTQIPVEVTFPWDRSLLSYLVPASMLVAALLALVVRPGFQPVILGVVLALAVGANYNNARTYQQEWEKFRQYSWQLAWRAPNLKIGTILITQQIPLNRYSDSDLTAPLNWMYIPESRTTVNGYRIFDMDVRDAAGLPDFAPNLPVDNRYRTYTFQSNTNNVLALTFNPPGCLKVYAPTDALLPGIPADLKKVLPLSNLGQIEPGVRKLPAIFGSEPPHTWCYTYEQASLNAQRQDWQQVVLLADTAEQQGFVPARLQEYLPFIEGYALSGRAADATRLTQKVQQDASLHSSLCAMWARIGKSGAAGSESQAGTMKASLSCK